MQELTFEEIIQVVQKLNPTQKSVLTSVLQADYPQASTPALLRGKYYRPELNAISEQDLNTYLDEISREWEAELDDFNPNR